MKRNWPFLAAVILFFAAAGRDGFDRWIDATILPPLMPPVSVEVLDRNGALLRAFQVENGRWRLATTTGRVDPAYLAMLVAYEDKRFYQHAGVDPRAMLRAGWQGLWHGKVVSGGSTLTMQVARLLENSGTGRWRGKLRQARVALALERRLSKQKILDLYLLLAPYGGNLEGVRAASLAYFAKEPARLTPAEAALLVALPQAPEGRRPDVRPGAARAARDRVLARVSRVERGAVLAASDARAALLDPVPDKRRAFARLAPHLAERARGQAPERLVHHLTIDAGLQRALEQLAPDALRQHDPRLSLAIVLADHRSGDILASVGSAVYGDGAGRQGFVDMTQALRSPGSTLKPLVYGLAFDRGLVHPETLINDRPIAFGQYEPSNFDGMFRGEIRVSEALRFSLNIPVVLLMAELGPARLVDGLRRAGVVPRFAGETPGLAIALGGMGVRLDDLVQLYAALARGGEGIALRWRADSPVGPLERVLSPSAAWQVGHILSTLAPPPGAPDGRLAYKTGTSYGHRDAWAVGYDGAYVAGVWIGRPDGTAVPGAFGGDLAAPVLFDVFARLPGPEVPLPPPPAETLLVSAADLPAPLRRFTGRSAAFAPAADAPKLAFPPDGAHLYASGPLGVRVRDGQAPFTWLANGVPVVQRAYRHEAQLPALEPGFHRLTVIDAKGQAAHSSISVGSGLGGFLHVAE